MEEKHQFEKLHAAITVEEAYFEVGRLSVELEWKYNPVLVLDGSYRGSTAYITLSVITLVESRAVSAMVNKMYARDCMHSRHYKKY